MNIYLSNDLSTWTNTFSNGVNVDTVVEAPSFSIRKSIKLGSLSSNNIRFNISGDVGYCEEFKGYKYIKISEPRTRIPLNSPRFSLGAQIDTIDSWLNLDGSLMRSNLPHLTSSLPHGEFQWHSRGASYVALATYNGRYTLADYADDWFEYDQEQIKFVGSLTTGNKTVIDEDYCECALQYNDLSSEWQDALFCEDPRQAVIDEDPKAHDGGAVANKATLLVWLESRAQRLYAEYQQKPYDKNRTAYLNAQKVYEDVRDNIGSGNYIWEWIVVEQDGYKVCDPTNPSKSLIHQICTYLPNYSALTISAQVTKSDTVKAFKVSTSTLELDAQGRTTGLAEGDKVFNTLMDVCKYNGINVMLDGFTLKFTEAYITNTSATTVSQIETEATLTEKPYKKYTYDDIEFVSDTQSFYSATLWRWEETKFKDTNIPSETDPPRQISYSFADMPSSMELLGISGAQVYTSGVGENKGYITGVHGFLPTISASFKQPICEVVSWGYSGENCTMRAKVYNKPVTITSVDFDIHVKGTATYTKYENVLVTAGNPTGERSRCRYIFSTDTAQKYDALRRWFDTSSANYWTFKSPQTLALGSAVALSSVADEVMIITSVTEDAQGDLTYTCSKALNADDISVDVSFHGVNVELPSNRHSLFVQCTRQTIALNSSNQPKDTTAPKIIIDTDGTTPTLTVNGSQVTLTEEVGEVQEEDGTYTAFSKNRWAYEVTLPTTMTNDINYTVTVGTYSQSGTIGTTKDGAKGDKGDTGENGTNGTNGAYNEYQFAKNTSPTTAPTTGWQDAPMDVYSGEYLWMRQRRVTF